MFRSLFSIIFILTTFISCKTNTDPQRPHIEIETKIGEIEIELFADKAPKTVAAFLANIDAGIYNNSTFYRILSRDNQPSDAEKTELIQGGIWNKKAGKKIDRPYIPHETTAQTGILHKEGVISMARLEPGTASTEFFICLSNQPGLDYGNENNPDKQGYAAFGKVVKGMDIVRTIFNRPETDQRFDPPIDIFDIVKL